MTQSIMTQSIMTLSIMTLRITTQHNDNEKATLSSIPTFKRHSA